MKTTAMETAMDIEMNNIREKLVAAIEAQPTMLGKLQVRREVCLQIISCHDVIIYKIKKHMIKSSKKSDWKHLKDLNGYLSGFREMLAKVDAEIEQCTLRVV